MPRYSAKRVCLAAILALTRGGHATPHVALPVNSQVPPVAYVSQPFDFTFSSATFVSDDATISYSLSNQPQWLSIDSSARRLSGTPTSGDTGAPDFTIAASDTSGTVTTNVTLVVLAQQEIFADAGALEAELSRVGNVSTPATLLLYPQQDFQLSSLSSLFQGTSSSTTFYATSSDGSPLPPWVQLDSADFRFSGTTPLLLSTNPAAQLFTFTLAASNVVGFAETSVDFEISISDHLIAFTGTSFNFSTTRGSSFEIASLLDTIRIDGASAKLDEIVSASADVPPWLSFNSSDLSLRGIVPDSADSIDFSLTIRGSQTNTANATIAIKIAERQPVSQESLGNVSAVSGARFSYTVNPPAGLNNGTGVTVNATGLPAWLKFNASNLTLQGNVPVNVVEGSDVVTFSFYTTTSTVSSVLTIKITLASTSPTTSASTSSSSSDVPGVTNSTTYNSETSSARKRLATLILAIVLPVLAVLILFGTILTWMWRHKSQKHEVTEQERSRLPSPPPTQQTEPAIEDMAMPGAVLPYESQSLVTNDTPQVELSWAPDSIKRTRQRLSKRPRTSFSSIIGSSWDDLIDFHIQSRDSLSIKPFGRSRSRKMSEAVAPLRPSTDRRSAQPPARPVRPASLFSQRPSEMFRNYKIPANETSQPTEVLNRLSGAGHGAGMNQTLTHTDPRSSWQTTWGTISRLDSVPNAAVLSSFPAPPSQASMSAMVGTGYSSPKRQSTAQPTLRLVESSSDEPGTIGALRQESNRREAEEPLEADAHRPDTWSTPTSKEKTTLNRSSSWSRQSERVRYGTGQDFTKTPPIPQKSQARYEADYTQSPGHRIPRFANHSTFDREPSMASSHQFDSAASSESHYDDRQFTSGKPTVGGTGRPEMRTGLESPLPRLVDQRKHVSIGDTGLERPERSYKGSLRFV